MRLQGKTAVVTGGGRGIGRAYSDRVYPHDTPGCTHCQLDSIATVQPDICDWSDAKLHS